MNFTELYRARNNEKVKQYTKEIIKNCEQSNFTVRDMKDLANLLTREIDKAIISMEEKTNFKFCHPKD